MERDRIAQLFGIMAERFKNENDLSDMTYSFLIADDFFKEKFLDFVFNTKEKQQIDSNNVISIQREVSYEAGRPDLVIYTTDNKFLIEVKKGDHSHHFDQYMKDELKEYRRSYITNYPLSVSEIESSCQDYSVVKENYRFVTWKDIYNELAKYSTENEFIRYYLSFLKNTCSIAEIKDMRFGDLSGLHDLLCYIDELINETRIEGVLLGSSTRKSFDNGWAGKYFEIKKGDVTLQPWIGVDFKSGNIYFEIFYNSELAEKINSNAKSEWKNVSIWENQLGFDIGLMEIGELDKFHKEENVEKQKDILKSFFNNCIKIVTKSL